MAKNTLPVATLIAQMFGVSQKALSEKLTTDEFNKFAAETEELQNRLNAQEEGNLALKADLDAEKLKVTAEAAKVTAAEATLATKVTELATANTALTTAQAKVTELEPKATQWDAYKASLTGTHGDDSSTGSKGGKTGGVIDASTQGKIDEMKALAARHPGMMAEFGIATETEA